MEAGAQVIITQLFYDVEKFIKFTKDCKALGIECPIIPGEYSKATAAVGLLDPTQCICSCFLVSIAVAT